MNDPLTDLGKCAVWIWLDDLSRERLTTGSLAGRDQVAGVTTDPSIYATAMPGSDAHSSRVRDQAALEGSWARPSHQLAAFLRQPPRQDRS